MTRIVFSFLLLFALFEVHAQKPTRSPKERVELLYEGLAKNGLSDKQVHWTFGFTDADSAHLEFIASAMLPNFKQPIKRLMAAGETFFPNETRLVIDIVDYGYYEKSELISLVSSITKALKKSSTKLTSLGTEVIDPSKAYGDFELLSSQPEWIDLEGVVVDAKTNEPIPGALVSFPGTDEKLTSDFNGQFSTRINRSTTDSVIVSALGYKNTGIPVANWNGMERIILEERYARLKDVVVEEDLLGKKVVLGQKNAGLLSPSSFVAGHFGEAAKQMKVRGDSLFLNKIAFHVSNWSGRPFEFLFDVYDQGSDGGPGVSLLPKKVSVLGSEKKGWVEVNVSSYNIVVNRNFFVALQWTKEEFILGTPPAEAPAHIGIKGDEGFYRKSQEAEWQKSDFYAWVIKAECTAFKSK